MYAATHARPCELKENVSFNKLFFIKDKGSFVPTIISCIITAQLQPATSYIAIKLRMIPDPSTTVIKLGV